MPEVLKIQRNGENHCHVEFMFIGFICHIKETMKLKFRYAKKDYQSNMDRESGLHFYLRIKHFSLYLSLPMY